MMTAVYIIILFSMKLTADEISSYMHYIIIFCNNAKIQNNKKKKKKTQYDIKPFHATDFFLHPLKTSGSQRLSLLPTQLLEIQFKAISLKQGLK